MIDELSREAEKIGISPTLFDKIIHQWSSPWRFYHHLEHLFSLYKFINQYSATDNYNPLLLAALYHDVVYNPLSNTNEEDSAEQFLIDCAFLEDEVKSTVNQLILDTKNHQATTAIYMVFCVAEDSSESFVGKVAVLR
jgi:predicted metal-dependent HD superfamily phosphohydrolase